MSQTQQVPKLTIEEKSQILKFYEQYKNKVGEVPTEVQGVLQSLNNKLWDIKKHSAATYQEQLAAFELIEKIHTMLGKKFDPSWKPREPKSGQNKSWIASKQQRVQNCNDLKEFLSSPQIQVWNSLNPFEQAQILVAVWGSVKQ